MVATKGQKRKREKRVRSTIPTKKMKMTTALVNTNPLISKPSYTPTTKASKIETKFADFVNIDPIPNSGVIQELHLIQQGLTQSQRIGLSIYAKNLFGRATFLIDPAAAATNCRIIFFQDTQQINASAPVVTDVLQGANYLSSYSWISKGRFRILYDEMIDLTSQNNQSQSIKFNIPVKNIVQYSGALTTNIQKNGLYMLYISNAGLLVPSIDYNVRIKYQDQ